MNSIELHKPEAFRKRFVEKLSDCETKREAYQEVEREYRQTFHERKYTSYKSFINSYYRAQKR